MTGEPLSYAPKDIPTVTGVAYTRVRAAIDSGELPVIWHSPKRCVVLRSDLLAWLEQLPRERVSA